MWYYIFGAWIHDGLYCDKVYILFVHRKQQKNCEMFENVSLRLLIWGQVESMILWASFEALAIPVNDVKTGLTELELQGTFKP